MAPSASPRCARCSRRCSRRTRRSRSSPTTSRACSTRSRPTTCCCRSRSARACARRTSCTRATCRSCASSSARCAARSATPIRRSSRSISCRDRRRSACSSRGCPASCSRRIARRRRPRRSSRRISGASNLVEVWLGVDQGHVRLKVFDANDNLYAIKSPRTVSPNAFQGTWSVHRPRVTDVVNKDAEVESSETVSISFTDGNKVSIRHVVSEKYFGAGNKGQIFRCSEKRTIDTGLLESFTGTLENGVILAFPDKPSEPMGADSAYCKPSHKADRIVAVKLEGDQVMFYGTDGNAYPEAVQLAKDVTPPPPAPAAAPAQ